MQIQHRELDPARGKGKYPGGRAKVSQSELPRVCEHPLFPAFLEQELLNTLKADYGFSQALSRSLAHLVQEHIDPTTAIYGAAHKSSIMPPVHMSDLENL